MSQRKPTRTRESAEYVYGVPVPTDLHELIESERDNLSKAESLLGCLAIAMEHESDSHPAPYYPDVAQMAREMLRRSINGLDSLTIQRHLLRNKVKEELGVLIDLRIIAAVPGTTRTGRLARSIDRPS
jgi:hypothetical protein